MFPASTLSTHFSGPKVVVYPSISPPARTGFRPSRISAACTSAERTVRPRIASHSSLYDVLGIRMGATCQEIKTAYRRLARVLHPDVASGGRKGESAEDFIRIHTAYATLSDPQKRADYDRALFLQRPPVSSPFVASAMTVSPASGFSGRMRRTWETDQCW